jgi:hypothetical protein
MVTHRHPNDQIVIVEMQNQAGGLLSESSPGLLFESAEGAKTTDAESLVFWGAAACSAPYTHLALGQTQRPFLSLK